MNAVAVRETPAPRSESIASSLLRRESDRPSTQAYILHLLAAMDRYAARSGK